MDATTSHWLQNQIKKQSVLYVKDECKITVTESTLTHFVKIWFEFHETFKFCQNFTLDLLPWFSKTSFFLQKHVFEPAWTQIFYVFVAISLDWYNLYYALLCRNFYITPWFNTQTCMIQLINDSTSYCSRGINQWKWNINNSAKTLMPMKSLNYT